MLHDITSIEEFRTSLHNEISHLDGPALNDEEAVSRTDNNPRSWHIDPEWTELRVETMGDQDWLLVAELLYNATKDPHLAGLVGDARLRAGDLTRWALNEVENDGRPTDLIDVDWRTSFAPREQELWFFTHPPNFNCNTSIKTNIHRTHLPKLLPMSLEERDREPLAYGPHPQDLLMIASVLLEHFYHPYPLFAFCSPVWRSLELAAAFAGSAGVTKGDIREEQDSVWYQHSHPGHPPWEKGRSDEL